MVIKEVVVHPLVLLSVVDHYNRVAKDTTKRVVGILLGELHEGRLDVTNSYAVPFEEDDRNTETWFFDADYHEQMFAMFKKVNAKEVVVGWYSTGPKIRPSDIDVNEMLRNYCHDPCLVIINVNPPDDLEIPTEAYVSIEEAPEKKSKGRRTWQHVQSEIGANEAEEVGVEHLLRGIMDTTTSTVADEVNSKQNALKALKKRLIEMQSYLTNVLDGKLPVNQQVIYNIQNIFSLLPDLKEPELVAAFNAKNNDNAMVVYLSSLIRAIISLHSLLNNKLANQASERKQEADEAKSVTEPVAAGKESTTETEQNKDPNPSSTSNPSSSTPASLPPPLEEESVPESPDGPPQKKKKRVEEKSTGKKKKKTGKGTKSKKRSKSKQ